MSSGAFVRYCVMFDFKAQTDHFIPIAVLKQESKDELAYEWKNFRYAEGVLNGRKAGTSVLDPFQVQDEWFEIEASMPCNWSSRKRSPKGQRRRSLT